MPNNVFRFRRLKWGKPEKPWLKRGPVLPETGPRVRSGEAPSSRGRLRDTAWPIALAGVLVLVAGWFLVGS